MLHLSLAGNMLTALDAKQSLYDSAFMPTYPSQILFDKIDMKLQPANKENLECFLKVKKYMWPQLRRCSLVKFRSRRRFCSLLYRPLSTVCQNYTSSPNTIALVNSTRSSNTVCARPMPWIRCPADTDTTHQVLNNFQRKTLICSSTTPTDSLLEKTSSTAR